MTRIVHVEIAGKQCALNCSTAAVVRITEKFGDFSEYTQKVSKKMNDPKDVSKGFGDIVWLIALLLQQGKQYEKIFEGKEDGVAYTADELAVLLSPKEVMELYPTVLQAITSAMKREVEVKPDKSKNVETVSVERQLVQSPGCLPGAES